MVFRLQDFLQLQNKSNNQYQLGKVKHFLKELQTGILLILFNDIHFQSLVAVPLVKFTKIQKFWVGRVCLAQELFYYKYPFHLPDFLNKNLKKINLKLKYLKLLVLKASIRSFSLKSFSKIIRLAYPINRKPK